MAVSIPSQINFSKLLSHTFPGIFTAIGISMLIYSKFFHGGVNKEFQSAIIGDWQIFIGVLGGLVFFGTLIGVIIDSIHHTLIESGISCIMDKACSIKKNKTHDHHKIVEYIIDKACSAKEEIETYRAEVFKDLHGNSVSAFYYIGFLPLERFQYLNDNYYSYVECEFNLFLSFFFSAFIYSYLIFLHGYGILSVVILFFVLLILSFYFLYSGTKQYLKFIKWRIDVIKGAIEHEQ